MIPMCYIPDPDLCIDYPIMMHYGIEKESND